MSEAKRAFAEAARFDPARVAELLGRALEVNGLGPEEMPDSDRRAMVRNNVEAALTVLGARAERWRVVAHNIANVVTEALEEEGLLRPGKDAERAHEITRTLVADALERQKENA